MSEEACPEGDLKTTLVISLNSEATFLFKREERRSDLLKGCKIH